MEQDSLSWPPSFPTSCKKKKQNSPSLSSSRRGSVEPFPVANDEGKWEMGNSLLQSLICQRSSSISGEGCSGWAPMHGPDSYSHLPSRFSLGWIYLFNISLGPQRLLQLSWSFRFTSLLLKMNICTVVTWTVKLRRLIVLCRHRGRYKSLFLQLPLQFPVSQRFSESFYLCHKSIIKENPRN